MRVDHRLDCEKLYLADDLADQNMDKKIGLQEASTKLNLIIEKAARYHWAIQVCMLTDVVDTKAMKLLCFGLSAGSCAPLFFGGGVVEFISSFLLGIIVGLMEILSKYELDPF